MEKNITIIGGGITGLATAIALNKLGISCQVFEKAPVLSEVGAGIWMQPNALKVLDWLGVGPQVRDNGVLIHRPELTDRQLRPFARLNQSNVAGTDDHIISIHRGRLQKVLFEALPTGIVKQGYEFDALKEHNDGYQISFQNGERVEGQVVLGADGINSGVRQCLFPASKTRYSGQTSWRGIARMDMPEELNASGKEAWGNKIRFGFSQLGEQEVYWFAVMLADAGGKDDPGIIDRLTDLYRDFHPFVRKLIQNTSENDLIRSDIYDLRRLPTWSQHNVCLIGDAAHATTPNMGQGGCQGLEDAYFMARLLKESTTPAQAFSRFEQLRRKKVDYVVNTSWRFGRMAHQPLGQWFVRNLMKVVPPTIMARQMKKIYALDGF